VITRQDVTEIEKIFGNTYLKVDINGKMKSVSHSLSYKEGELVA
jgi:hypothetical protein